ncbi:unnamed protein product [Nippostrongylus brasiliensis]|uniref:DDE_Tnp_1_7 domain-containing protein n=1 Tax=Nippostrongylus brasiliensis TaxID=27835 RepID=A0A0N4XHC4_NIPBR|nr:unnamed protein product [Nippostrongylus brasiliensis]
MDDEEETEEDQGFSLSSSGMLDESRKCYLVTGPEENDDEEDEWDEGNSFSDNAMQILDDLKAGVVAEDLKDRLRIPRNSSNRKAMMTIFKLIEVLLAVKDFPAKARLPVPQQESEA